MLPSVQSGRSEYSAQNSLSVLSLNVWGVFAAQCIEPRMKIIRDRLGPYDVICFQEQFDEAHGTMLMESGTHPHFHRFVSAPIGSGLAIASKYPMLSHFFVPFRAAGPFERVWEGDALANKGVAVSRVLVPRSKLGHSAAGSDASDVVEVLFFNTHLIAQYERYSVIGGYETERNAAYRLAQAHQLAQLVVATVAPGAPFVMCGDFNAGFGSPEMNLIKGYLQAHGLSVGETVENVPSYDAENIYNAKTAGTYLQVMSMTEDMPVQLDHVLFGTHALGCVEGSGHIALAERVTVNGVVYQCSDHYGVAGSLVLTHANAGATTTPRRVPERGLLTKGSVEALTFASAFLDRREKALRRSAKRNAAVAVFALVLVLAAVWRFDVGGLGAAVLAAGAGIATALTGCVGITRHYAAIAMRGSVQDLQGIVK